MIQIAQHVGAEIFVTVSTAEKSQLMQDCGVQKDHILDSRDGSFAKAINRMTDGQGVDVIVNTLSGEALRQSWACISPFGRFVELGKRDVLANSSLEMKHFSANVTFSSVNVQVSLPKYFLEFNGGAKTIAGNMSYCTQESCATSD